MAVLVRCNSSVDRGEQFEWSDRWVRCGGKRRVDDFRRPGCCPNCGASMAMDWSGNVEVVAGHGAWAGGDAILFARM